MPLLSPSDSGLEIGLVKQPPDLTEWQFAPLVNSKINKRNKTKRQTTNGINS